MRRLVDDVHAVTTRWWDPDLRLLVHPGGVLDEVVVAPGVAGLLAPTVWWAHGLLARGTQEDVARAHAAVAGVLDRQHEASEGDDPDQGGLVGTGLALLLRDHELPTALAERARTAVVRAVHADRDRAVDVTRTTVATLRAWLELEVGRWTADEELLTSGAELARAIAADAGTRGHVAEHSSPTATGMVLLGLSLWAERPPVPDLGPLGAALRDEVWHDLLAVWHPGLGTLVPPFSRAYGMDLRAHVGATALWIAWLVDGVHPLPPLDGRVVHRAQELPLAFLVDALAGASDDVSALAPLVRAQPARQGEWFDRVGERVWTGWTGGDLAVGGEWSPVDRGGGWQVVPAAAVWRGADGGNAWLRLQQASGPVEARVDEEDGVVRLVHGTRTAPVQLWLGGGTAARVEASRVVHGGRTWHVEGVDAVRPAECEVPQVAAAWELTAGGDGIVLWTEA